MKHSTPLFLFFVLISTSILFSQASGSLLIQDVRLFDGENIQEQVDVLFKEGKIAAISPGLEKNDADEVIDGKGRTLIPALINAHVHAWFPLHLQEAAKISGLTKSPMRKKFRPLPSQINLWYLPSLPTSD